MRVIELLTLENTTLDSWEEHLAINLTAPFLLSQAFASTVKPGEAGRIINILDWRATRPTSDYLPYTVSKAALAALTRSLAIALAPHITVTGLALGPILPEGQELDLVEHPNDIPAGRWGDLEEVNQPSYFSWRTCLYNWRNPAFDGCRHLV
jgi:NAD(P)-dependent dehydrogenase (short-subunit alcohol dehydrogenase family)